MQIFANKKSGVSCGLAGDRLVSGSCCRLKLFSRNYSTTKTCDQLTTGGILICWECHPIGEMINHGAACSLRRMHVISWQDFEEEQGSYLKCPGSIFILHSTPQIHAIELYGEGCWSISFLSPCHLCQISCSEAQSTLE